jgi:hypothetical protein
MTEQNLTLYCDMTEQLYVKKGRRYVPWGNTASWNSGNDAMKIGTFRLIHCPEPGYYRYRHDVTPDTAAFLAAAGLAQHAMEKAIHERAIATPLDSSISVPHTPEQQAIIEKFRHDMAEMELIDD